MLKCVCLDVTQIDVLHRQALDALRQERDWFRVRPAFTCDLWCSATQREYLTVSAHWIEETFHSVPPQRRCQWLLRRRIVATVQIDGDDEDKVTAPGELGICIGCHATTFALINGGVHCIVVVVFCFVAVIRDRVNAILDDLKMTGWYKQIVTDCGSNAKSAFRRDKVWDWMRCACHLLHNVVEAGFKRASEDDPTFETREPCLRALTKAKAFVAHIHHSRKASERFNSKQRIVLEELRHRQVAQVGPSGQRHAAAGGADDGSESEETMEAMELEPGVPGFDPQNVQIGRAHV